MATLIIDGQTYASSKPVQNIGDLVAEADQRLARHGRIVTALRLGGVDEPAFREPHVVNQSAAVYTSVEIESGTPAELAGRCLFEAGQALSSLADAADSLAMRYRVGDIDEASRELVAITEGIGTALAVTGAASLGLGIDLGAMATSEGTIRDLTMSTSQQLEALITAQLESEWDRTADLLEEGLAPMLRRWSLACGAIVPPAR